MQITQARISRTVGKFNFANPAEEAAQVSVFFTADGKQYCISDLVEPGSQFDYDGDDISDAVDAVSNSIERYWISTDRKETQEKIAFFLAHEAPIRRAFAISQAVIFQKIAARYAKQAMRFLDEATSEVEPAEQSIAA